MCLRCRRVLQRWSEVISDGIGGGTKAGESGGEGVNAPGLGGRRRHPRTSGTRLRSRKVLWRSPRVVTDWIGGGERAGEAGGRQPNPLPLRLRASVPGPRARWGHRSRAGGPVRPGDAAPEPGEAPSSRPRGWGGGSRSRSQERGSLPVRLTCCTRCWGNRELKVQGSTGLSHSRTHAHTHTDTPSRFGARSTLTRPGVSVRE